MKVKDLDFRIVKKKNKKGNYSVCGNEDCHCNNPFLYGNEAKNRICEEDLQDCEIEFFTGFKDENECKIYEGDIVDTGDFRDVVKFEKSKGWILQETLDSLDDYQDWQLEVIGNIHENPELLGGEK